MCACTWREAELRRNGSDRSKGGLRSTGECVVAQCIGGMVCGSLTLTQMQSSNALALSNDGGLR